MAKVKMRNKSVLASISTKATRTNHSQNEVAEAKSRHPANPLPTPNYNEISQFTDDINLQKPQKISNNNANHHPHTQTPQRTTTNNHNSTKSRNEGKNNKSKHTNNHYYTSIHDEDKESSRDSVIEKLRKQRIPSMTSIIQSEFHSLLDPSDTTLQNSKIEVLDYILTTPLLFESVIWFGVCICTEHFLYVFSLFPLRIIVNIFKLLKNLFSSKFPSIIKPQKSQRRGEISSRFEKYQAILLYNIIQFVIFLFCCCLLFFFDSSVVYHWIRQQQTIKLYVIFNILEILEKLCCSLGSDVFHSLYFHLLSPKRFSLIVHSKNTIIALCYSCIHVVILYLQVITLNVAINSSTASLFPMLLSNNFVELKGSVFKRFSVAGTFQLTCHDIVERFQLMIFVILIFLHNVKDIGLLNLTFPWVGEQSIALLEIFLAEVAVDWIKHAFVNQFNFISPQCYIYFRHLLQLDMINSMDFVNPKIIKFVEPNYRIAFVPFPLAALVIRMTWHFAEDLDIGNLLLVIVSCILLVSIVKIIFKYLIVLLCMKNLQNIKTSIPKIEKYLLADSLRTFAL